MPVSFLEESIAGSPDSQSSCCTRCCAKVRSWCLDAARAVGPFDLNPGTAGDLCTEVEAANLKDGFQASAGTNYMVYRKSVLMLCVMLFVLQIALNAFTVKSNTDTANEAHDRVIVVDPKVQADCQEPCSSTAAEVAAGVNDSFEDAGAVVVNQSYNFSTWDLEEVVVTAFTTCMNLCVGARTPGLSSKIAAGSTCRLDWNASMASNNTVVVCDRRERAPPSALNYRLALIELAQNVVSVVLSLAYVFLLWAAVNSWRHFRSSMRYICLAVFATLAQPYIVSLVPWYELFNLQEVVSDSPIHSLSPDLADIEVRAEVTVPVFLGLQSGLLALFPALSYAAVTAKTFDPGNSFMDALLAGVPVFLLTFNYPIWALVYQVTGSVWLLSGGLIFSGSRLLFTCHFQKIAFSDDTAATIKLLSTLSTRYLLGLCLGVALIAVGMFFQFRDLSLELLMNLQLSTLEIVNLVADYYLQFYVSYIAAADILIFGAVHFGNKRVSVNALEDETAGLFASYNVLTSEEAVFNGGTRSSLCSFPI